MYRAVLDTCVLVPSVQRDFLLQLATEGAFAPLWSTGTLTELDYVVAKLHERREVRDSPERRDRLLTEMAHAFPGSTINAPRHRTYDYGLQDPQDGHVVHAALIGNADAIVTDDRRAGFKAAVVLKDAGVEVVSAAAFAANTVAAHPSSGIRALMAMSARHRNPPRTPEQILDLLVDRYRWTEAAGIVRPLLAERT